MTAELLEQTLGRTVRARRVAANLTQVELAERANLSVGAVQHLETGAGATIATLVKVLRVLGAEAWLDQLAPPAPQFSPLQALQQQQRAQRASAPRQRVSRTRAAG
ncbi:MAG: helix-turn-helix transcriptional regulator [Actinomycetota bacterium]|nr:helix-turn-helix transcriptional regulator [Actinomycetota bacterium]